MASTPLLGLSLPADGTTNWGTLVNTSITALLDSAVAGTTTISSSDATYILTATTEATNEARQAIILCTGARAGVQTIIAPQRSKTYVVINATTGSQAVKIAAVGPTTGVTVPNGKAYMVAWNGSDFVTIGVAAINLATDVTGTLPVANGGTGQTSYTDGQLLIGNTSGNTLNKATLTASTGISVTNGAGAITITNTAPDQTVLLTGAGTTSISGTYPNFTITSTATPPAGATTQIQYNNAGAFAGSANLTFASNTLSVNGINVGRGAGAAVSNTAIGSSALNANVGGTFNTALGYQSLYYSTSASNSTAVGYNSLNRILGSSNVGVGDNSLQGSSSPGIASPSTITGANNVAVGSNSLSSIISGSGNTAVGSASMSGVYLYGVTGSNNTGIGYNALSTIQTGGNNTGIGYNAGNSITTGSSNVVIGGYTGFSAPISGSGNNYVVLSDGDGNVRAYWNGANAVFNGQLTLAASLKTSSSSSVSSGTITPNSDTNNQANYILNGSTTFAAPSGTPSDGQKLLLRLKDNGIAQTLSWNAAYRVIGAVLPTTTVASKITYVGCIYNTADAVWDVVTVTTQA